MRMTMAPNVLVAAIVLVLALQACNALHTSDGYIFGAALTGAKEVPPVENNAGGVVTFQVKNDGRRLFVEFWLFNIFGVTQAHIHCGAPGTNGPVVAFVWPGVDATSAVSAGDAMDVPYLDKVGYGKLGYGSFDDLHTIDEDNLIVAQPTASCPNPPTTFRELLDLLNSGNAYFNVHTTANPAGAVRGNIAPITPDFD
eukprot:jgi/Mesvir1/21372/Mv20856-RA.1